MYEIIEEYSRKNNLIFGIIDAKELEESFLPFGGFYRDFITNIPFFIGSVESRLNPALFLENAKSVIVLGAECDSEPTTQCLSGIVAKSVCAGDYHKRLYNLTRGLICEALKKTSFNYKIQVDSGSLYERGFALKAGLGFTGMNQLMISSRFGTFFNIALIVIDKHIDCTSDKENSDKHKQSTNVYETKGYNFCQSCMLCIKNCPGKALSNEGMFVYEKCVSYITQKKGVLTEEEMLSISTSIYGCDVCQSVCPFNNDKSEYGFENRRSNLLEILNMSKREYDNNFRNSNFYWRGRTTILRNCLILLYNIGGENDTEIFQKYASSGNEVLKQTAKFLLNRTNNKASE